MRRSLNTTPMPAAPQRVEFVYPELTAAQRRWWLIVDPTAASTVQDRSRIRRHLYVSVDLRA